MSAAQEVLDVVDEHDRVIGQARRDEVHARGLRHRAVHIFLFNAAGDVFVQKRSATKDTFPGRYDSSASGHLETGEDYDACALRELREELRLEVPPANLRKHLKISACADTGWEFIWVYSVHGDYRPVVNPQEIEEGAFWPRARVEAFLAEHPQQCAPSFIRVFEEFRRRRLL
jgi:isopentenyl-diphosphate delta-isomerase